MEFSTKTVEMESLMNLSKSTQQPETSCFSHHVLSLVVFGLFGVVIYQHLCYRDLKETYRLRLDEECSNYAVHESNLSTTPLSLTPELTKVEFPSCSSNSKQESKIRTPLPEESKFISFADFATAGVGENVLIPKVIHQTGKSWDKVPKKVKKSIEELKSANPSWEYRFYSNEDVERYIRNWYGDSMLSTYMKINPMYGPSRADFFRYLLIYNEGGAYFDLKSTARRPLDEILGVNDEFILSHWNAPTFGAQTEKGVYSSYAPFGEFQQWHIIATPKHPFLKAVIEEVCHRIHHFHQVEEKSGKLGALHTTGPYAYTEAIRTVLADDLNVTYTAYHSSDTIGFMYSCCGSHTSDYVDLPDPVVL